MECFALVYVDYEGLELLALGNKYFVKNEYNRIKKEIKDLHNKYNYGSCKTYELPDEFYMSDYCYFDDIDKLCIRGYKKNGKLGCLCDKFEIKKMPESK